MEKTLQLNIKLFGAFRKYHAGMLTLSVAEGASVRQVKDMIGKQLRQRIPTFQDDELIERSALATRHHVLGDCDLLSEAGDLAILPPVCGG